MLGGTEPAEVLAALERDGIPRELHAAVLAAGIVPIGPVDRLVVVPEAAHVHIAVGECRQAGQHKDKEQQAGEQDSCAQFIHDVYPTSGW